MCHSPLWAGAARLVVILMSENQGWAGAKSSQSNFIPHILGSSVFVCPVSVLALYHTLHTNHAIEQESPRNNKRLNRTRSSTTQLQTWSECCFCRPPRLLARTHNEELRAQQSPLVRRLGDVRSAVHGLLPVLAEVALLAVEAAADLPQGLVLDVDGRLERGRFAPAPREVAQDLVHMLVFCRVVVAWCC